MWLPVRSQPQLVNSVVLRWGAFVDRCPGLIEQLYASATRCGVHVQLQRVAFKLERLRCDCADRVASHDTNQAANAGASDQIRRQAQPV